MFRRQHAIVLCLAVPTVAVLGACSEDEKATPQVIFDGQIQNGSSTDCQDTGSLFTVGDFGNLALEPPTPSTAIKDGQAFGQGAASVSCSVTSAGADQFAVNGSVALSGATGGLFRVDGIFKTTGEQANVYAIFTNRASGNTYEQKDRTCTVRYTSAFQGVAAGRVWGEVTCPKAENASAQKSCQIVATFRFENCTQ